MPNVSAHPPRQICQSFRNAVLKKGDRPGAYQKDDASTQTEIRFEKASAPPLFFILFLFRYVCDYVLTGSVGPDRPDKATREETRALDVSSQFPCK
jgi:hypothetical protein